MPERPQKDRQGPCFYCPNIPEFRVGNRTHKGLTDIQTVTCAIKTDSKGWTEYDQGQRPKLNGFVCVLGGHGKPQPKILEGTELYVEETAE